MADISADPTLALGSEPTLAHASVERAELPVVERGEYTILDEVARGGMGRLVRAVDRTFGRQVAIKELRGDRSGLAARFVREARLTAHLQHPGIVPIYDAGRWPNGEPFYAMKFVAGRTLSATIAAAPTLLERLRLVPNVIAVADAIAFAHQERIIHRDLKPDNVLVGDFGETIVVDWGLAKHLGSAEAPSPPIGGDATIAGAVMGTPAYMPPEQARGEDVDERADVYALGALLYHVLAGVPPYRGPAEVVLALVCEAPPPPLPAGVPAELVTIVGRAMARDPDRRYATARELAEELRRFAAGKLVATHAYSAWQLLARWARRHRAVLLASAIFLTALAVVSTLAVLEIVSERDRARSQRAAAEGVIEFMVSTLDHRLEPVGQTDLLDSIGTQVVAYYHHVGAGTELPPASALRRAEALRIMGTIALHRGDFDRAESAFDDATALIVRAKPTDHAVRLAAIQILQADLAHGRLQHERAIELYGAAIRALEPTAHPERDRYLSSAYDGLGESLLDVARVDRAAEACTASLEAAVRWARAAPADRDATAAHGRALACAALVAAHQGDDRAALARHREAVGLWRANVAGQPGNLEWQQELATALVAMTRFGPMGADAVAASDEAIAIFERLVAWDPDDLDLSKSLAWALLAGGTLAVDEDRLAVGTALLDRSEAIRLELLRREPANATYALEYARVLLAQCDALVRGELTRAGERCGAGLATTGRLVAAHPDDRELAFTYASLLRHTSTADLARGDTERALDHIALATRILRDDAARSPADLEAQRELALALGDLWTAQHRHGDDGAALATQREALAMLRAAQPDPFEVSAMLAKLGALHYEAARYADALGPWTEQEVVLRAVFVANPDSIEARRELSSVLGELGTCHFRLGDNARALRYQRESLDLLAPLLAKAELDPSQLLDATLAWAALARIESQRSRAGYTAAMRQARAYAARAERAYRDAPATRALIVDRLSEVAALRR